MISEASNELFNVQLLSKSSPPLLSSTYQVDDAQESIPPQQVDPLTELYNKARIETPKISEYARSFRSATDKVGEYMEELFRALELGSGTVMVPELAQPL